MCGRQNQHRFTCAAEDSGFIFKDVLTWNKGKAPFRAQKVSNIYAQRGLDIDYEGDWRLGNLSPYCEPIVYMFKPYKVGTTVTDQFIENKLGCFNADLQEVIEIFSDVSVDEIKDYTLVLGSDILNEASWSERGETYGDTVDAEHVLLAVDGVNI